MVALRFTDILNNEAGAQVAAAVGADLPSNEDENNSDDVSVYACSPLTSTV